MISKQAKLIGSVELLQNSWQIYKARFATFIGIGLIYIIPISIHHIYTYSFLKSAHLGALLNSIIFSIVFLFYLFGIFAQVLVIFNWTKTSMGVKEAYARAWKMYGSALWIFILMFSILFGGTVLLFIPVIIFETWMAFHWYVFIDEGKRGLQALLTSREYVRNYFVSIFLRKLLMLGLYFGALIGFSYIANQIIKASHFNVIYAGPLIRDTVILFMLPFVNIYYFLMYRNLKDIKGKVDLSKSGETSAAFKIAGSIGGLLIVVLIFLTIFASFLGPRPTNSNNYKKRTINNTINDNSGAKNININLNK